MLEIWWKCRKFLFWYLFCMINYWFCLMLVFIDYLNKICYVFYLFFVIDNVINKKIKEVWWSINVILIFFLIWWSINIILVFLVIKNIFFFLVCLIFGRIVLFYKWLKNNEKCWLFMIYLLLWKKKFLKGWNLNMSSKYY